MATDTTPWRERGSIPERGRATIAGPRYNRQGILLDHFWIASRQLAWASFYVAPVYLCVDTALYISLSLYTYLFRLMWCLC